MVSFGEGGGGGAGIVIPRYGLHCYYICPLNKLTSLFRPISNPTLITLPKPLAAACLVEGLALLEVGPLMLSEEQRVKLHVSVQRHTYSNYLIGF